MNQDSIERCARMLADILHCDVDIPQRESMPVLREACRRDGSLPSEEEAETLIMAEESAPELLFLSERYPTIDAALAWLVAGVVPDGSPVSAETLMRWAVEP